MGFRDLKCFNQALLARSAWRLCKNSSNLLNRALKASYYPNSSLLHAPLKKNSTWAWKSMYGCVDFIRKYSFWQKKSNLGTGLEAPPIPNDTSGNAMQVYNYVSELICPETMSWSLDIIDSIFDRETADKIIQIRIPRSAEDNLVWTPTNNGLFTVKSSYDKLV